MGSKGAEFEAFGISKGLADFYCYKISVSDPFLESLKVIWVIVIFYELLEAASYIDLNVWDFAGPISYFNYILFYKFIEISIEAYVYEGLIFSFGDA